VEWAWFFYADLREQLEAGAAVLVSVFDPDLGEDARHRLRADPAVNRRHRSVPARRCPGVCVLLLGPACQQTGARELLDTDSQAVVHLPGLDGHDGGAQSGGTGRAGIGDVVHGDAGLADLLLKLLADTGTRVHEVARGEHSDVSHRDARV